MARYIPTPLKGFCIVNFDTMLWGFEPDEHIPDQPHDWFVPACKQYLIERCRKDGVLGGLFKIAVVQRVNADGTILLDRIIDLVGRPGYTETFECDPEVNDLALQTYMRDEPMFAVHDTKSLAIQQPVLDWMVGLQESADVNDQALFAKIGPKMKFEHAIKHSERWHAAMARKAEKRRKLGIVDDDPGCPVCLTLDGEFAGWTWRWLNPVRRVTLRAKPWAIALAAATTTSCRQVKAFSRCGIPTTSRT